MFPRNTVNGLNDAPESAIRGGTLSFFETEIFGIGSSGEFVLPQILGIKKPKINFGNFVFENFLFAPNF